MIGACLQGAPGAPAAAAPAAPPKEEKKPEANDAEDDSKFDQFMGNDAGALAGTFGEYDQDDREADEVSTLGVLNLHPSIGSSSVYDISVRSWHCGTPTYADAQDLSLRRCIVF